MKLRIRSVDSKETHRIEVPNSSTLQQLKAPICAQLSSSSSSSSVRPNLPNLFLSLNRKDELYESSPQDTLQSLGVASGDLIYFSLDPCAFSSKICQITSAQDEKSPILRTQNEQTLVVSNSVMTGNDGNLMSTETEEVLDSISGHSRDLMKTEEEETLEIYYSGEDADEMELDEEEAVLDGNASFSVPTFLRKVFKKEVGDEANARDHRLLVIAVHAVLLESGFVAYNTVTGLKADGFHLPGEWPSLAFTMSLTYTILDALSSEIVDTVTLKLQTLGKFVNVYGSLSEKGSGIYRVSLDESRVAPALNFIWKNSEYIDAKNEMDGSKKLDPEREVFEFWRVVKDGLALPLLIDLCEKAGLPSPSCFTRLPTDLKLKILELLPASDISKMACVCSELRFVCSNDDLWRLKWKEEIGTNTEIKTRSWKARYCAAVEYRRKGKNDAVRKKSARAINSHFPRILRDPIPFAVPFVIGGEYDRIPLVLHGPRYGPRRRNCIPGGCIPGCIHGAFP